MSQSPAVPDHPAPADLVARLAALERQHRRLRRTAVVAALGVVALVVGAVAQPGSVGSRVVLTAPNGQTTATLELGDDGTLQLRIAGTLRNGGRGNGGSARVVLPLRGEFAFVPGVGRGELSRVQPPRGPELQVLQDGRVLAHIGGPIARPLMP